MKKLLNILLTIMVVLSTFVGGLQTAQASSNTLRRDENRNYRVNFSRNGRNAYVNFIYGSMHRINGKVVICLEPDVNAINGASYTQRNISNYMNASTRATVEKIYHHGFVEANTGSVGSSNWWLYGLTTKYMIYEQLGWDVHIVQWGHSRSYNEVKREIMNKVNNHDRKPSFDGERRTVDRGDTIRLTDSRGVLNEFTVTSNNTGANVSIEGNRLVVNTTSNSRNGTITLSKYNSRDIGDSFVWGNANSQDMGDFKLPSNVTATVRVNFNEYGEIRIEKFDAETSAMLAGAEFRVTGPNNYENVVTTNSQGVARLRDLPVGRYTVVETKSPSGYVLNPTPQTADVTANRTVTIRHANAKEVGEIRIEKFDAETNEMLAGAEFRVTGPNNYENVVTTNSQGVARLRNLPVGRYTVVETKSPDGYVLDSTSKRADVKTGEVVRIRHANEKVVHHGELRILKVDEDTQAKLAGAEFRVTGPNNYENVVTTNSDGVARLRNLVIGEYTIVETKAPEGYVLDAQPRTINIEKDKVAEITVTNKVEIKYGSLIIEKRDEETKELLAGAKFRVTGPHGFEQVVTTGADGRAVISNVPVGEYTIVEIEAPEGYELDPTPIVVQVVEDDKSALPILEILNPRTGFLQFGVPALALLGFASYTYKKTDKRSAFSRI